MHAKCCFSFFKKRWRAFLHFFSVFGRQTTWPYGGKVPNQAKSAAKFRLSSAMVRTSRLAARLFALRTRTKWKKVYKKGDFFPNVGVIR